MDAKPSVLIVSNSSTKPASIIKLITKQNIDSHIKSSNLFIIHPWIMKTKYYTSEIQLVAFNGTSENFDASFVNTIEGLIIHMDSNKTTGLDDLKKWTNLLDDLSQPEIKILVANYCNETTKISKQQANLWCLDKGFEFIELFPSVENKTNLKDTESGCTEEEEEEQFGIEKVGVERVIEALENNLWSNMEMSDKKGKESTGSKAEDENDQFFELFSNLMAMKTSITSLPSNVRKQCAEQMVTAFWKAIGGDEDEISEITDL